MSIEFKNQVTQGIDAGFTTVYTCPGGVSAAIIFGMSIANVLAVPATITVEARIRDLSALQYVHVVAPDTPIEVGGALVPAGGVQKFVLEPGDSIEVSSSDADSADVFVSVLEIT